MYQIQLRYLYSGAWLSLVERGVRDAEVAGSNPVAPIFYVGSPLPGSPFPTENAFVLTDAGVETVVCFSAEMKASEFICGKPFHCTAGETVIFVPPIPIPPRQKCYIDAHHTANYRLAFVMRQYPMSSDFLFSPQNRCGSGLTG